jgi:UDP-N-acetylmuramoylalanine--D-glutamate ligase
VIPIGAYAGRDVAVFGLTEGTIAAARALAAGGANVHPWDDAANGRAQAEAAGLTLSDINARDWRGLAALVMSEKVVVGGERPHRIAELARAVGVPIVNDVFLFAGALNDLAPHARPHVIGVGGGDVLMAALIGHILTYAGKDARVAGVDAAGVLGLAPLHAGAFYVLPLTPAQIALARTLRCDVSIAADAGAADPHLFDNQGAGDWAIVSVDATGGAALYTRFVGEGARSTAAISARQALGRGVSVLGPHLFDAMDGAGAKLACDLSKSESMARPEDALRAAAAYAAGRALGVEWRTIAGAIANFPGLDEADARKRAP